MFPLDLQLEAAAVQRRLRDNQRVQRTQALTVIVELRGQRFDCLPEIGRRRLFWCGVFDIGYEPSEQIPFVAEVPSDGRYRLFLEFRHHGVVRTVGFVLSSGPDTGTRGEEDHDH